MARTVVLQKRADHHNFGIYIGEDIPSGIYIVTIEPNSPAAEANIQPGDRVLAFNGQLVSLLLKHAKNTLVQTAANAQTLTLSIESTNILGAINESKPYSLDDGNHHYPSTSTNHIDHDLEKYIKSLFSDPTLHIIAAPSSHANEYILISDKNPSQPYYPRHSERRRKRRHRPRKELSAITNQEQQINQQSTSTLRAVPSMGTSHVMLRNTQNNPTPNTNNTVNQNPGRVPTNPPYNSAPQLVNNESNPIVNPPAYTATVPPLVNSQVPNRIPNQQPLRGENSVLSSSGTDQNLREVNIHRSPDFQGFGFHLQYNKVYYIIQRIESGSPAERSGLKENDVIREINHQSTDRMSHNSLVEVINENTHIKFLVQPFDDYFRSNPHVPLRPDTRQPVPTVKNDGDKRPTMLTKALTKLKSR
ncbi:hypothetical protein I4U23_001703 [Adineta vaga]|nr:hypothetical protein I4U23_001703 [Adineta vaga]